MCVTTSGALSLGIYYQACQVIIISHWGGAFSREGKSITVVFSVHQGTQQAADSSGDRQIAAGGQCLPPAAEHMQ